MPGIPLNYFGDIETVQMYGEFAGISMDFGVLLVKLGLGSYNDPCMPSKRQVVTQMMSSLAVKGVPKVWKLTISWGDLPVTNPFGIQRWIVTWRIIPGLVSGNKHADRKFPKDRVVPLPNILNG